MPTLNLSTCIRQPIETVFRFVTSPEKWPRWNPCSLRASGSGNHQDATGETINEYAKIGSWQDQIVWTVRQCKAPSSWVIEGKGRGIGQTTQKFSFKRVGEMTLVEWDFIYSPPGTFFAPIEQLFVRHKIEAQLNEAVANLKTTLEKEAERLEGLPQARLLNIF